MKNIIDLPHKRRFALWSYNVSHSRLLIRSGFESNGPSTERIDLYFSGVKHISLPSVIMADKIAEVLDFEGLSQLSDREVSRLLELQARNFIFYLKGKIVGYLVSNHALVSRDSEKTLGKSKFDEINLLLGLSRLSDL